MNLTPREKDKLLIAMAAPAIIGSVLTAFSAGRVPSDVASGK